MEGKKFRLIGNTTSFSVAKEYLAAGFIPSVVGISQCGRKQTCARIADIIWL